MKKTIIALFVSLLTMMSANAKTIDYLVTGTPGGTAYDNAELFIPILERVMLWMSKSFFFAITS